MTMIVTRDQAADHLRIDDATAEADDLDLKILAASDAVLDYIERDVSYYEVAETDDDDYYASGPTADGDEDTSYSFPYQLQAAVLLLVGDMHRYRDSGDFQYKRGPGQLPEAVRALLYPLKSFGIEDD